MKWWLARKSFKFLFTMPKWLRGPTIVLICLAFLLVPILGLVAGLLILVTVLLALIMSPLRKVVRAIHLPWS